MSTRTRFEKEAKGNSEMVYFTVLSMVRHCPRKMCAAPGAYMPLCHTVNLPSSVARRPLCHKVNLPSSEARRPLCHKVNLPSSVARRPLCHKVNLPRYEARRRHLIMTCDIYRTEINKLNVGYHVLYFELS